MARYKEAAYLYLQAALGFTESNQQEKAITSLMHATSSYEKDQDWRKIGALWDRTGEHIRSQLKQENQSDLTTIDSLFQHNVIGSITWERQQDLNHKAAWTFQWAAQHFEKEGGPALVSNLYRKAGYSAEQATNFRDRHRWAGMLFEKAAIFCVRNMATQEAGTDFDELLLKMQENYLRIGKEDGRKISDKYAYLLRGYRNIRLAFQIIGESVKAEEIRRAELETRYKYETVSGKYFQALITRLTSHIWITPVTWVSLVFIVFPLIYWATKVLIGAQNSLAWYNYVSFSIMVATTSGYGVLTPTGVGAILTAIELVFSYALLALIVALLIQRFMQLRGGN